MRRLVRNRLAVFGMVVVGIIAVAAIVGPAIIFRATGYTYDYIPPDSDLVRSFPPSWTHPMGTDNEGRDMLARVLLGGRISLMVGIISTIVSLLIGITYGAAAGYAGGKLDERTKFDLWRGHGGRRLATRKDCRAGVLRECRQGKSE